MNLIGELVLDLKDSPEKVVARIFVPEPVEGRDDWACRYEISDPFDVSQNIFGVTSLQALTGALKVMSAILYSSSEYKSGELGIFGEFGGSLSIPAPHIARRPRRGLSLIAHAMKKGRPGRSTFL